MVWFDVCIGHWYSVFPHTGRSYNDSPLDFEQGNFSIKHDEDLIIPLAIRAQQALRP